MADDPAACAACGHKLRPGAGFCSSCGRRIGDTAADAADAMAAPRVADPDSRFTQNRDALYRAGLLFALLLLSFLVLGWVARFDRSPWPEVICDGADALIVLGFAIRCRAAILPLLRLPRASAGEALQLGLIAAAFVGVLLVYFAVLECLGLPIVSATGDLTRAGWGLGPILLLVSVSPAIIEELALRGVIQSSLDEVFGWRDAWIIQAAMFSVLHLSPLMFPSHFAMGLCFGYLRHRTKSLYPGMALHAGWNALIVLQEMYG